MKFRVRMKDPDTLTDAIELAVDQDVTALGLPKDEKGALSQLRQDKIYDLCSEWFDYGEYLLVEIDTEAKTCIVVPRGH